ncbi:Hypothetical predicted protein [Paramuricea clavata]|uniref:Uncharacterized protein n=1 Tax=Paramuricea clavata TaxID=317549 RepID=A0A6S7FYU8_PARCT|nr:Hypothetical predicted protein [Paramuricea clavata]
MDDEKKITYDNEEEEIDPTENNYEEEEQVDPTENDENNDDDENTVKNNNDDENESEYDSEKDYSGDENYSADDEEEVNNEASALFLKQIWDAHCMTIQKQKQSKFIPATKRFLAATFAKKEKMLNDNKQLVSHLVFLCRNIANGKIPLNISECEKALFTHIADRTTNRADMRLRLLEEFAKYLGVTKTTMGEDVKRLMLIDTEKYNAMIKNIDRLVANKGILDEAKQTAVEGELIEGYANMMASVAKKQPNATDDINYSKKRKNYRKELQETAAAAGQPAAGGPAPKPGSLASSEKLIRSFLKQRGVVETDKGTKFGNKTLNFSLDDMVADLTKNVTKKKTNLNEIQHQKLLKELKKLSMPVYYIRSENLKGQYRSLSESAASTSHASPPAAYETPPPQDIGQITPFRQKGKSRAYMV